MKRSEKAKAGPKFRVGQVVRVKSKELRHWTPDYWRVARITIQGRTKVRIVLAVFILSLSGCHYQMSNEAIIRETKKCQEAGLNAEYGRNFNGEITDVQCGPKVNGEQK